MGALLQMTEMLGNLVTRNVDGKVYDWMRAISTIADNISGGTQGQVRYVNKLGNDATGDGSFDNPFLTIQAAITSITDASLTKPYAVLVAPGIYTETFAIPPYVYVHGEDQAAVVLNPVTANWITAGFAAGTQDAGLSNVTLKSPFVVDFSLVASAGAGTFSLTQIFMGAGSTISFTGNNINNIATVQDVVSQAIGTNFTLANMTSVMDGIFLRNGLFTITGTDAYTNTHRIGSISTGGAASITWTGAVVGNALLVNVENPGFLSTVTLTGVAVQFIANTSFQVTAPDANTTFAFGNLPQLAGSTILPGNADINMQAAPTANRTYTFEKGNASPTLVGSRLRIKNNSLFTITIAFTNGATGVGNTYIPPGGYFEMFGFTANWFIQDLVQFGTVALTNGVSAAIPADITAQSIIVATLRDLNGAAGVICAKAADRVVGTFAGGGSFKLTSVLQATGATVATDQGTYDWMAMRP